MAGDQYTVGLSGAGTDLMQAIRRRDIQQQLLEDVPAATASIYTERYRRNKPRYSDATTRTYMSVATLSDLLNRQRRFLIMKLAGNMLINWFLNQGHLWAH